MKEREFLAAHTKAFDMATLGLSCMREMAALLSAIRHESIDETDAHSLASLGTYLAESYLEMFDQESTSLEMLLEMVRLTVGEHKKGNRSDFA